MSVAIGIDSHKSSLAAGVLDDIGRVVGTREFANDEGGHRSLLEWIESNGDDRVVGLEGSGATSERRSPAHSSKRTKM
jgi:transposase